MDVRRLGGFSLKRRIATGGMAEVFLFVRTDTGEERAVKILQRSATSPAGLFQRFLREIEIMRGLQHPNIVPILDSGVVEDRYYYYMMPYCARQGLDGATKELRKLEAQCRMFRGVCEGMAFAHARDIVHRDLKPSNVLISDAGIPMVSDFGIAKILDASRTGLTGSAETMGTLAYLAPEQRVSAKRVDRRADVYALGALLYEMVMHFPPLGHFPWPRETRSFPGALQDILVRCLQTDPERRFADAGEIVAALDAWGGLEEGRADREAASSPSREEPAGANIRSWLQCLREAPTGERLRLLERIVETILPEEAEALLELYPGETQRVRWGLIQLFGALRLGRATALILPELGQPLLRECAIEALGRIGSAEAFEPLRTLLGQGAGTAAIVLVPLARTGGRRALEALAPFLHHSMATLRQNAVRAMEQVEQEEACQLLRERIPIEPDADLRALMHDTLARLEPRVTPSRHARDSEETVLLTPDFP